MLITTELLRKYNAYEQEIKYIEQFYPNGIEMIDLIKDKNIDEEFLHWVREYLIHNDEELAAYCASCNIINTESYWYSQDVKDSKIVIKSKKIEKSTGVFNSEEVLNSTDIVGSDNVENCSQVFYSSMVDISNKIVKGQNIVESANICNSTMVARSVSVIDSNTVFDSSEIIKCNTVTNSYFCQDCINIENCMFCNGLEGVEYYIFNKPVDEKMYKLFEKQYKKYLTEHLSFVRDWPHEMLVNQYIALTRKFDDWYYPISEKFWKWARTLPGYDPMLLYNITMIPDFLMEATD